MRFFSAYNRRVCKWSPGIYSVDSVLENWGHRVFCDHMVESQVFDSIVMKSSQEMSAIGDKDIYLLAARCKPRSETNDFRALAARRRPLYSATIAPSWVRCNTESQLWTSSA